MALDFKKSKQVQKTMDHLNKTKEKYSDQFFKVKSIHIDHLHDDPNNDEDISYTKDLEISISENGFTTPIEVTDANMPDDEYMIVSGHRRYAAARKIGMEYLPCIVRNFKDLNKQRGARLMANAQRNDKMDPLLYVKRYKKFEQHLKEIGFKGNIAENIAERMGIKVAQAKRYAAVNRLDSKFHELIKHGKLGVNSAAIFSSLEENERDDVYNIILEALKTEEEITRETSNKIKKAYEAGARSWDEINSATIVSVASVLEDIPVQVPVLGEQPVVDISSENTKTRNVVIPEESEGEGIDVFAESLSGENEDSDSTKTEANAPETEIKTEKKPSVPPSVKATQKQKADLLTNFERTVLRFSEICKYNNEEKTMYELKSDIEAIFAKLGY